MTLVPEKGSGVKGILDIINPILAGVSLGRGGSWGLAGGLGSLAAQVADAIWRSKQPKVNQDDFTGGKKKKSYKPVPVPPLAASVSTPRRPRSSLT